MAAARFPQLADAGWLRVQYLDRGRASTDIAAEVGCSADTVTYWMRHHGIPVRLGGPTPTYPQLADAAWVREQYVEQGRTATDIATEVGCALSTVRDALRRHDIEPDHAWTARDASQPSVYPQLDDATWVRDQYVTSRRPLEDIATELGCSPTTVGRALSRHQIEPRKGLDSRTHPKLDDSAWLREQYVTRGQPLSYIAADVGCSPGTVARALRRHDITVRPRGGQPGPTKPR